MEKDYAYLSLIVDVLFIIEDKKESDQYLQDNYRFVRILIENMTNKLD